MWALRQVISGGQTGADLTALECAKEFGWETGGWAPRHYRTENGSNWELRDLYRLQEMPSEQYPPRTRKNVASADLTVWFGGMSPGWRCTYNAARDYHKPMLTNPTSWELFSYLREHSVVILNVAGNRASTNPLVESTVRNALRRVWELAGEEGPS